MLKKIIITLFLSTNILSHEFNPPQLLINEVTDIPNSYDVKWVNPLGSTSIPKIILPTECIQNEFKNYNNFKNTISEFRINCEKSLKGEFIEIKDLDILSDAIVSIKFLDNSIFESFLSVNRAKIEIPYNKQIFPLAYLYLGFDHLLNGLDHIVFLICLLFIVFGWFNLLKVITSFTIAHSITLAISVLDIFTISQNLIEALIALTIIFVSLDVVSKNKKTFPWYYAFGFGLLHGFGFSGALLDIGINNNNLIMSLLFFNIGIEIGQLAIILIPLLLIYFLKNNKFLNNLKLFIGYTVGGISFYWFIERVIGIIHI